VPGAALVGSLPTCQARVPRRASPGGLAGPRKGRAGTARPRSAATSATPKPPPASPAAGTSCGPGSGAGPASGGCAGSTGPAAPAPSTSTTNAPTTPPNPRHAAAHPDHGPVSIREDTLLTALAGFFDQHLFGHDRAELLAAQLPATAAGHAEAQARQITHLNTQLNRIDTAERGLISELEAPADPADPAAAAYRARYAELYQERTKTEAERDALQATATPDNDPTLLDELPTATGVLADARPDHASPAHRVRHLRPLQQGIGIYALCNKEMDQVTIRAVLTQDTPGIIAALLTDPRTDDDISQHPTPPASKTPDHDTVSHFGRATPVHRIHGKARIHHANLPLRGSTRDAWDRHGPWDARDDSLDNRRSVNPAISAASTAPSSQQASRSGRAGVPVTQTGGLTARHCRPAAMPSTARTAPPVSMPPCTYRP